MKQLTEKECYYCHKILPLSAFKLAQGKHVLKSMLGRTHACNDCVEPSAVKERILSKYPVNKLWWPSDAVCPAGEVRGARCSPCECKPINNKEKK